MTSSLADSLMDASPETPAIEARANREPSVSGSIMQIPVGIQVVIGSTVMPLSRIAELGAGSVITLDQQLGSPVIILVNGKEVATGDLFVIESEGDRLGIRLTSVADRGRPSTA